MAKVLKFPKKEPTHTVIQGYRMSYYTDEEIELALRCVNTFGVKQIGYTRKTLKQLEPLYITEYLIRGYNSDLVSALGRKLINKIIDGIEKIEVKVK